ncbi:potassium channel family protein [Clostridium ammoniilyticum]|uniref:Potassium channel family protein n=1 Tax=[Clostridium] ammoniilyticum TaxID=2981784 RepID=A0ABT2SS31_9FIRM|nr:ion transporter [[Clostridium] ammoniilyticum]MCU6737629.1 potassium channel family protein [[Clostridium] ammoniilyticum]
MKYPFSFMAIIDLLSILPSINMINKGFKSLKTIRLIRTFRVLRIFKSFRYSKNIQIILQVEKNSKKALIAVLYLAIGYIFVCTLIIFNVEPDSFNTFFDAIYWATISLTTVGYGDIYPITTLGRIITMVSSFMGIAIVALPASIITAGYMKEIESDKI